MQFTYTFHPTYCKNMRQMQDTRVKTDQSKPMKIQANFQKVGHSKSCRHCQQPFAAQMIGKKTLKKNHKSLQGYLTDI